MLHFTGSETVKKPYTNPPRKKREHCLVITPNTVVPPFHPHISTVFWENSYFFHCVCYTILQNRLRIYTLKTSTQLHVHISTPVGYQGFKLTV